MAEERGPWTSLRGWVEEARVALLREGGQTLVEYAAIIGFIGIGTIAAMIALGPAIGVAFQAVTDRITDVCF